MLCGKNDMVFFTDAMEGIIQTYPKSYGYEKIDVLPNKAVIYSKGTPYAGTVKRIFEIYEKSDKYFMEVLQKKNHADMAIFVKDSDVEMFIYDHKVKEIDIVKRIEFVTELIKEI